MKRNAIFYIELIIKYIIFTNFIAIRHEKKHEEN